MKIHLLLVLTIVFNASCALKKLEPVKNPRKKFKAAWIKNLDPSFETGNLPIGLGSPLIHDGIVYFGAPSGKMSAYNLEDGRELWSADDKKTLGAQPTFYKDQVLYGSLEGRLFSRHYLSGELKYSIDLDTSIEHAPTVAKGRMIVQLRNHKLMTLDVETGKILWSYKRSVPFSTTVQRVSRPKVIRGMVYVGFADGHICAFNLEDGSLQWERKLATGSKFIDVDTDPLYQNGLILAGSLAGMMTAVDPKTGNVVRSFNLNISRAPLLDGAHMYAGTVSGDVVKFNKQLNIVLKKKVTDDQVSSIVKWKDHLAVSTTGETVYLLNPKSLEVVEKFHLGSAYSAVFGGLQVSDDSMAFLSSRYRLYVFN